MFCDGIMWRPLVREIPRRKENSSLDFLHKVTLDVLYLCFSDVCKWRFVQANRSDDVWDKLASLDSEISNGFTALK